MVTLTLTDEQAETVQKACDLYVSIRMGQFQEITWTCLDQSLDSVEYCKRRELAEELLILARRVIYPDLAGHSYGMGKFKDADLAFDVHQVIRYAFDGDREPFSYYELPKCERTN